jgi:CRISPR-associated exonuclease Cas4
MLLISMVFFLILAVALFWLARQQRRAVGLPGGRVIYADTRAWGEVEQPLYDAQLGLTGKPDYLVEQDGQIIPVEVKSSRVGGTPHDSHVYQLAAYCLLVERRMGKRPPYGILHYPNRTFAIDYTSELEQNLLALLDEMHAQSRRKELGRSHDSPARCSRCGYRGICDQRLL